MCKLDLYFQTLARPCTQNKIKKLPNLELYTGDTIYKLDLYFSHKEKARHTLHTKSNKKKFIPETQNMLT